LEYLDNSLIKFWIEEESNNTVTIKIDIELLLSFLEQQGFGKMYLGNSSTFLRIDKNIISQVTAEQIKDYVFKWLKDTPITLTKKSINKQLRSTLIRGNHILR